MRKHNKNRRYTDTRPKNTFNNISRVAPKIAVGLVLAATVYYACKNPESLEEFQTDWKELMEYALDPEYWEDILPSDDYSP